MEIFPVEKADRGERRWWKARKKNHRESKS
jgi:hypothetical protein